MEVAMFRYLRAPAWLKEERRHLVDSIYFYKAKLHERCNKRDLRQLTVWDLAALHDKVMRRYISSTQDLSRVFG